MEKVASVQFDVTTTEDYHIVAASCKGDKRGIREDAYLYKMLQNCLVAIVCDGHGCK